MVEDAESSTAGKTMPTSCFLAPSKGSSRSDDVRYMEPSAVFSSAQLAFDATENVGKSRPVAGGGDLSGGGDGGTAPPRTSRAGVTPEPPESVAYL